MDDVIRWDEWGKGFNSAAIGMHCNIEQYRMLKRCSERENTSEWNSWRWIPEEKTVWLCGADLRNARLDRVDLHEAHLDGANLAGATLRRASLTDVTARGAILTGADLEKANLAGAHLEWVQLQRANLYRTDLSGANLGSAHLQGADTRYASLNRCDLFNVGLHDATFQGAIVDGSTRIWDCRANKDADFTGVALDSARVEPGLKQLLKANIREKRWKEWYGNCRWWDKPLVPFVWLFWLFSDYGRSTSRIALTFLIFALAFGGLYHIWPDFVETNHGVGKIANLWHALYFSVVTMTTLGFGDIHANPASGLGQTVLMAQVILGYVLLGALVTRFAILFSGEGPAQNPSPPARRYEEK